MSTPAVPSPRRLSALRDFAWQRRDACRLLGLLSSLPPRPAVVRLAPALRRASMRLGFSCKTLAFGWVLGVALSPTCTFGQKAAEWTYKGAEGPGAWGKLDPAFATCAVGQTQSPIDIKNAKKSDLPPL